MIVVAMPEEVKLVEETGEPILITGVGAINVIEALQSFPRGTPIRNVGYAGSNVIPVGTRCRIGKVASYHPNADFIDKGYILDGDVTCLTASDFVLATDIKIPCVFDMELAFILALGFQNVTSIKIVSDNLSKEGFKKCMTEIPSSRK